ncbi:MAG: DUF2752 domain-containing protein [Bacteroidota bacterium]|jgi:hypothetical protein
MALVLKYIRKNWLFSTLIFYEIIAIILKFFSGINLTIPCFFNFFFKINCPGCGLTRAFISLISLNFADAWNKNPLIFFVIPIIIFFLIYDFNKFKRSKANL